jgi:hypothetical protein
MEAYIKPEKHRKPVDASAFMASLNEKERELHVLAERLLGSSYFLDRTHSYTKWKKQTA